MALFEKSMNVPVMYVRVVWMAVGYGDVSMLMAVLATIIAAEFMRVLMMLIVGMRMFVFQNLMLVFVGMVFSKVQPHPKEHQRSGNPERW